MKKLHELTLGTAFTLLALSACTNEALLPDAPQVNEPDNPDACVLMADDFRWEGNESRTALTIEDNVAKFSWTTGDKVGILPDEGAQVYFTIPEPEEGVELTEEQRRKASFDGGAWALKATSNYAAYYPFIKDFDLQRTAVPVNYTGQKQTGNNNAAHLGAYDYMGARPVTTNENGGGVTFDFDHVGALVLLQFTVPEIGTALKSVTLSADDVTFTTQGTYDLTSDKANGFPITASATASELTIGLDHTTTVADEAVTLYFMCAPIDLSGKTVNVSVACGTEGSETIEFEADGKNLVAAGGYLLQEKEPPYLTFSATVGQTLTLRLEDFLKLGSSYVNFEYSVDGAEWSQLALDAAIAFGGEAGDLRLRAKSQIDITIGTAYSPDYYYTIEFGNETPVECTGDIRTLVDWENYATANTETARFCNLFQNCTSLTTAPELPAPTLADNCYFSMFSGCTALITAPELPATTLAESCYYYMFSNCHALTTAPVLPATTLAESCYESMFYGCTNLSSITMLATDVSATKCLFDWVDGVASSGTFYKNSEATWTTTIGRIPTGWTVQDYVAPEN